MSDSVAEEDATCQRCGRPVNESGFRLDIVEGSEVRVRTEIQQGENNLWRAQNPRGYYCSIECLARTQVAALEMISAALPGKTIRLSAPDQVE